jgi:Uma2 family endonuclease
MATATEQRYTPEDLLDIDDRAMPELVYGELLEREMGQESDGIAVRLIIVLGAFVQDHKLGLVNGGQGSYQAFPDDPKKVRIPDVSFTRAERLIGGKPAKGHARVAPDLAVEIASPNDSADKLDLKIKDYLNAGVSLIWIIYPESQSIFVQRLDGTARRLQVGDVLDGEDVIPGFQVEVAALFE